LNKERRILAEMGDRSGKYRLYHRKGSAHPEVLVNADNWIDVLRSEPTAEQLDLWMERAPETGLPHVEVTAHTDNQSDGSDEGQPQREKGVTDLHKPSADVQTQKDDDKTVTDTRLSSMQLRVPGSHRRNVSQGSGHSSIASHGTVGTDLQLPDPNAFLQWPFEEDKEGEARSESERVKLWLDKSLDTITANYGNDVVDTLPGHTPHTANQNPQFERITSSDRDSVRKWLYNAGGTTSQPASPVQNGSISLSPVVGQGTGPSGADEAGALFGNARRLLKLFVPEKFSQPVAQPVSQPAAEGAVWHTADHKLVKIYWGIMDRIITVS
jgi:hypothetical protein